MRVVKKITYGILSLAILYGGFLYKQDMENKAYVRIYKEHPYATIVGPIVMADGIGRQTAELANVLGSEFNLGILPNHVNKTDVPEKVLDMLKMKRTALGKVVLFEESLWGPGADISRVFHTPSNDSQLRIAYSMFEANRLLQEWVIMLNLYFDAVVVPDPFLIKAYQESGVKIPIFFIPLAIDLDPFLKAPLKASRGTPMVFANLSTCLARKNHLTLVKAFDKAFKNNPDVVLWINARESEEITRKELMEELDALNCQNIFFTELSLRSDAYLKKFQEVDCYVSLSKGEGFSIQPREAMALGIPTIVTSNTGQTTICESGYVKEVKSLILEPGLFFGQRKRCGNYFNCSVEEASLAMKEVYEHYDEYLLNGAMARRWASQYSYNNDDVSYLFKSLLNPEEIKLGSENIISRRGVLTSSTVLFDKYQKLKGHLNLNQLPSPKQFNKLNLKKRALLLKKYGARDWKIYLPTSRKDKAPL